MLNDINQKQNTQHQLERLAAQRYLYSRAKRALVIQVTFDLLTPLVAATLVVLFPGLDIYAAFAGVIVVVLDLVLENFESSTKRRAADIQELFDCDVLGLPCQQLKVRHRPIAEIVMEAARSYRRTDPNYSNLINWYPPIVEKIPLHLARLVCQRINCWWDSQLRQRYAQSIVVILVVICLFVILAGLINGVSIGKFFFAIVTPLLPTIIWGVREYRGQLEAAKEKDELRSFSEELWTKALKKELSEQKLEEESRNLQDEIYNNRRSNPFILDWFFKRLRRKNEEFVNRGAEELVNEALP